VKLNIGLKHKDQNKQPKTNKQAAYLVHLVQDEVRERVEVAGVAGELAHQVARGDVPESLLCLFVLFVLLFILFVCFICLLCVCLCLIDCLFICVCLFVFD